ncbi:aryl-sulfate sulfotransferase [uncultured Shewanella sp.]|uniref:aryl-sulfate sulfotransferase n=1 Tax=uncultured Shewanella sp. TaxID=173975 RepID=UPI00260C4914|nr:aryl-sulfate sulfotransferase [uncultured Shewanella sp.]
MHSKKVTRLALLISLALTSASTYAAVNDTNQPINAVANEQAQVLNQGNGQDQNQGNGQDQNQNNGQDPNQNNGQDSNQNNDQDPNQDNDPDQNQGNNPDQNQGNDPDSNQGNGQDPNQNNDPDSNQGNDQDPNQNNDPDQNQGNGQDPNQGNGQDPNQGNDPDQNQGNGEDPNQNNDPDQNQGNKDDNNANTGDENSDKSSDTSSYVLYSPLSSTSTYLVDTDNNKKYEWTSDYIPGQVTYLDSEGYLVRTGYDADNIETNNNSFYQTQPGFNFGGVVQRSHIDADTGETVIDWTLNYQDDLGGDYNAEMPHHDIAIMPNGHILMLVWIRMSYDEAVQAGRNPDEINKDDGILSERIIEVEQNEDGSWNTVWQWNAWDHLVQNQDPDQNNYTDEAILNSPEKLDVNYITSNTDDIFHLNNVYYIEDYDQIIVSSNTYSELWVIDHSTTSAEAATNAGGNSGKGGDLLYRWGNPEAYGYENDTYTFLNGVHDVNLVLDSSASNGFGTFVMYGNNRNETSSQVIEITPPINSDGSYTLGDTSQGIDDLYGPFSTDLTADIGYQQNSVGSAEKLTSGDYITCDCGGTGKAVWIDSDGKVTGEMDPSLNTTGQTGPVFRLYQFEADDSAFTGIEK